ncbi:MAG: hypothetical protein SFY69_12530 [Planctomycetota bacterium]|nr:hypothetical protein [Planctomycetota bacterium]
MSMTRTVRGRAPRVAGALCIFAASGAVLAGPDPALLRAMPGSVEFVAAAGDLRSAARTPAFRGAAAFVDELGTWSRSVDAWGGIARALGMTPQAARDEVFGSQIVYAMRGVDDERAEHALFCEISGETERLLRERLRPAPRGLERRLPILALENGAFDVSTWMFPGAETRARVLICPKGSERLFDSLLPALRTGETGDDPAGPDGTGTLGASRAFAHLGQLPEGDVAVLSRRMGAEGERFLVASVSFDGADVRGAIVATRDMLLPGRAAPPAGAPDERPAWPGEAVELLAQDATLLVAGSPREQPLDLDAELVGERVRSTLLLSLLGMMRLPPSLEQRIDGIALVAVHELRGRDEAGGSALSISVAVPTPDVDAYAPLVDGWGVSLAGDEHLRLPPAPLESVRVLSLSGEGGPVLSGLGRAGGSIAWTFAKPPGGVAGWWVLNIRTSRGDELGAGEAAKALAMRLSEAPDAADPGQFRLLIHPARLTTLLRRDRAPAPDAPSDALRVFRWIERFESNLERAGDGLVRGRVSVRVSEAALAEAERALPPAPE